MALAIDEGYDVEPAIHRFGRLMIDNPIAAMDLLERLTEALPITAHLTTEMQALLRKQIKGTPVLAKCQVTGLHYTGDEGGILCKLDFGPDAENAAFVSITHLRFDARLPLARAIAAYQKHRVKHLQRQHA